MTNTKYNTTEDLIDNLQSFKGKTKIKFHQNIGNFYDEMNNRSESSTFQFEEDPFSKNAEGFKKIILRCY